MPPGGRPPGPSFCARGTLQAIISDISGMRAVVMGLGLFGGGEGAARFLAERGAHVTVTDLKPARKLSPPLERLSDLPLRYTLGWHNPQEMLAADLLVANPAVPRTSELLKACAEAGVLLTSPMNLFLALCRATVAAVTGSVGKSTTSVMLTEMLRRGERDVWLGGNIGLSLLPRVHEVAPESLVVLEMSSVQIQDAAHLQWSPHLAVVTNLIPNHLDRYGTYEAYAAAKRWILAFQKPTDVAVLNAADPGLKQWARGHVRGALLRFDPVSGGGPLVRGMNLRDGRLVWSDGTDRQVVCSTDHVSLPGVHNLANAMAAATAARWLGIEPRGIREALANLPGLEHRLEPCGSIGGRSFYNDSDSTTPQSTMAALGSLDGPVTLIAGGASKGLDLAPLAAVAARRASALITLGESGPFIASRAHGAALKAGRNLKVRQVASLADALQAALELSEPGSSVLFSPACASFDMFQNFADRGRRFKELVRAKAGRQEVV